ncbi:MAG: hypothetical protein HWE12_03595 [Oceanospirillaceae bacterium]|nr:hypothetical protein [Oceanospirillaceae bacterium]
MTGISAMSNGEVTVVTFEATQERVYIKQLNFGSKLDGVLTAMANANENEVTNDAD